MLNFANIIVFKKNKGGADGLFVVWRMEMIHNY